MAATKPKSTDDILKLLCDSVQEVLSSVTKSPVSYSPMVQKIHKICLRPDIGTFVMFDGGFSGLVIINFSGASAVEIYQEYMVSMGMPLEELAQRHTSDEVGDTLAELMNQIVGDFQASIEAEMLVSVNQSQPKMLAINKEIALSISTQMERPQSRKVGFKTAMGNLFYLEMAMEKTEFIELHAFEKGERQDPDHILQQNHENKNGAATDETSSGLVDDDLIAELGL